MWLRGRLCLLFIIAVHQRLKFPLVSFCLSLPLSFCFFKDSSLNKILGWQFFQLLVFQLLLAFSSFSFLVFYRKLIDMVIRHERKSLQFYDQVSVFLVSMCAYGVILISVAQFCSPLPHLGEMASLEESGMSLFSQVRLWFNSLS